jgi:4-carboxymuconolactone decarboxylase
VEAAGSVPARSEHRDRLGAHRAEPGDRDAVSLQPGSRQRREAGELSEIVTHLAFYTGWANGTSAVAVAKDVFDRRNIPADQLPPAAGPRLPLDQEAEAQRAAGVAESVGPVAPGLEQYTTDVLFRDLWLRSGLTPRDRSLVTVSALISLGHVAQIPYHLNRAMDSGLTKAEASEVLTHLAFYAGWPKAFSAVPVAKGVFDKRPS